MALKGSLKGTLPFPLNPDDFQASNFILYSYSVERFPSHCYLNGRTIVHIQTPRPPVYNSSALSGNPQTTL